MILLDTHALIWIDEGGGALGPKARQLVDATSPREPTAVSAITFWEVAILLARRRLKLRLPPTTWRQELLESGLHEIPMDGLIGLRSVDLDIATNDPADRIIIATAHQHRLPLLTADRQILEWDGDVERIDARF